MRFLLQRTRAALAMIAATAVKCVLCNFRSEKVIPETSASMLTLQISLLPCMAVKQFGLLLLLATIALDVGCSRLA
jgi:hypothetical protein